MILDCEYLVVIGFPHNQKTGGLDSETKRSLDGIIKIYPGHVKSRQISLLFISGKTRSGMQKKNYSKEKFMSEDGMAKSDYLTEYLDFKLASNVGKKRVGVILLIHATSGFPKIFDAQNSTSYISKDNKENGLIIARLLKTLGLSGCIEKLQLVACNGAKCTDSMTLLEGIGHGIIAEGFSNPPMVIGWDAEVTHNDDGTLKVQNSNAPQDELEHRHVLVATEKLATKVRPLPTYDPTKTDNYQINSPKTYFETVLLYAPSGYQAAHSLNWSKRAARMTTTRCVLL